MKDETEGRDAPSPDSSFNLHPSPLSDAVQFIESTDRALVPLILKLDRHIDLVIPRGGESLIRAVVADSTIPVLKHYTGNCHIYVDAATHGIEEMVRNVCINAKTSYPGGAVCNAVEHTPDGHGAQAMTGVDRLAGPTLRTIATDRKSVV